MKHKRLIQLIALILFLIPVNAFAGWTPVLTVGDTYFSAIWGSSATDVYAVGYGPIYHYDGSTWSAMTTRFDDRPNLTAVWGISESNVFAVGINGSGILHYNGVAWSEMRIPGGDFYFSGIWGASESNVYAVGELDFVISTVKGERACNSPIILHYDGVKWSQVSLGIEGDALSSSLLGIWGSSENDIFAVGYGNYLHSIIPHSIILHYDGKSWSQMKHPFEMALYSIWGSSATDVFAVGKDLLALLPPLILERDAILHYDGANWSRMDIGQISSLGSVWGDSSSDVFVTGLNTILHYNGVAWSDMVIPGGPFSFTGIWGTSRSNVYAATDFGAIFHYDGTDGESGE